MMQAVRPQKQKQKAKQKQKQAQAQETDTSQIVGSHTDSLQVVNLLLTTGIGCITFLRGIFPERTFGSEKIDSTKVSSLANEKPSSVRVKTLRRGELPEADRILDYMEYGVSDALAKGYLKTLMFGIYLDPNQPHNLVELYTFNFVYRTETQVTTTLEGLKEERQFIIPEMEVRDQLRDMHIGGVQRDSTSARDDKGEGTSSSSSGPQPAGTDPKKWTVSEVRKQVQALVRRLIIITQNMSELPKQRYITFKLYYTDETPDDYEPPHFHAVEHEKTKFRMGTRDPEAQPVMDVVGRVDTGHHCLTLRIASISDQLPDVDLHRSQGTPLPTVNADANARNIVWDGEEMTLDEACDVSFESKEEKAASKASRKPVGKIDQDTGAILPWSPEDDAAILQNVRDGQGPLGPDDRDTRRAEAKEASPQRLPTITHELAPDKTDPEETQFTESEKLAKAAEETPTPYSQDTIPVASAAAETFVPPAPARKAPLSAESYMFSQSMQPTQRVPDASQPESQVPSSPPSLRDAETASSAIQGVSETVPKHLQRLESTFGYEDLLASTVPSRSGYQAGPTAVHRNAEQADPLMDFSQTQHTQAVQSDARVHAHARGMVQQDSESVTIRVSEANKRRQDRPLQRVHTPDPIQETEEIQDSQEDVINKYTNLNSRSDNIAAGKFRKPDSPILSSGRKPGLPGTPKKIIEIPDTPPSSPLTDLSDDPLPDISDIYTPKGKTPTDPKASSASDAKTPSKKGKMDMDIDEDEYEEKDDRPCDCGSNQAQIGAKEMAQCDGCDTWCHPCCHGYTQDAALPEEFFCYKCIVSRARRSNRDSFYEDGESGNAHMALSTLALFRKALCQLYELSGTDDPLLNCTPAIKFATFLQVDLQDATPIWDRLRSEEYIIVQGSPQARTARHLSSSSSDSSKKGNARGKAARNKAEVLVLNKQSRKMKTMKERYFTPGRGEEAEIMLECKLTTKGTEPIPNLQHTPKRSAKSAASAAPTSSPARQQLTPMQASPQPKRVASPLQPPSAGQSKYDLDARNSGLTNMVTEPSSTYDLTALQSRSDSHHYRFSRTGHAAIPSSQPAAGSTSANRSAYPSSTAPAAANSTFGKHHNPSRELMLQAVPQAVPDMMPEYLSAALSEPSSTKPLKRRAADDDQGEAEVSEQNNRTQAEAPARTKSARQISPKRSKRTKVSQPDGDVRGKDDEPNTEAESEAETMDEDDA